MTSPTSPDAESRTSVLVHDHLNSQWHVYYTMETFHGPGSPPAKSGPRVFHDEFDDNFTNLAFTFEEIDKVLTLPGNPAPCDPSGGFQP